MISFLEIKVITPCHWMTRKRLLLPHHLNSRNLTYIVYPRCILMVLYRDRLFLRCHIQRSVASRLTVKFRWNSWWSVVCVIAYLVYLTVVLLDCIYFKQLHSLWTLCLLVCLLCGSSWSFIPLVFVDWTVWSYWSVVLLCFFVVRSLWILKIVWPHKHWLLHVTFLTMMFLLSIAQVLLRHDFTTRYILLCNSFLC